MATRRERIQYELDAVDNASRVLGRVQGSAERLQSAYSKLAGAVTVLASGAFVRSLVHAAEQGEQSQQMLTAALRATGERIGITRKELDELADSMANATQFDDDSIRQAEGQLVKFGNITGDVFRGALRAAADLAAFMGTDITTAAQQVGRALQSPTEGITLLERTIGKLTEAEEYHIKTLAEQGRGVEAQEAVLKLLQERMGGTAALMNTGLKQATTGVSKAWDDMLESWGRTESIGGRVRDMLGGIRDILRDLEVRAPDPFVAMNAAIAKANEQIDTLEKHLQERRSMRRAWGGAGVPDDPEFAQIQARIDRMRAARAEIIAQMEGIRTAQSLEESLGTVPATPKRLVLGGMTTNKQKDDAIAKMRAEAAAAYAVALQNVNMGEEENLATKVKLEETSAELLAIERRRMELANDYAKALAAFNEGTLGEEENLATAVTRSGVHDFLEDEYRQRLAILRKARDQQLLTEEEYNDRERELTFDHQRRVTGMWQFHMTEREKFLRMSTREQVGHVLSSFEQLTSVGATQSKKWFEVNKHLSAANAAVKGYESINNAYAWGSAWGGPAGGAAMAALAALAVGAQVLAIESTTFEGGGRGQGTFSASAATGLPVQPEAPRARGPDTFVTLRGDDLFSGRTMAKFFERANEFIRDGGRFVVEVQE